MTNQSEFIGSGPSAGRQIKNAIKAVEAAVRTQVGQPLATAFGRLKRFSPRPPRMIGAYPDRETALANAPKLRLNTYDHADVAAINFEDMCETMVWDYPVMFWLSKLQHPGLHLLDAGGHWGTKYVAFRDHIDVTGIAWTVYDLPETMRAATSAQRDGIAPAEVTFIDDLANADRVDLLLASGLLQYLDRPLPEIVAALPSPPDHIILNKVATREGPSITTLELIGPARVPYQIRNRDEFEAQFAPMGYAVIDQWDIPHLGMSLRRIPSMEAAPAADTSFAGSPSPGSTIIL